MLELSKLIVDRKLAWIDFQGIEGFKVKVQAISRKELVALRANCVTQQYDRKERKMVETLDEKAFVKAFTDATVAEWEGLTLKDLTSLVLMETGDEDLSQEYPYTKAHAYELVTYSTEFDTWLNEVVFDLDNFRNATKEFSDRETG